MEIGVFISYNHADRRIAGALKQCLLALSPNLNVFIDHESLEAGDNYEEKLARVHQQISMVSADMQRPAAAGARHGLVLSGSRSVSREASQRK